MVKYYNSLDRVILFGIQIKRRRYASIGFQAAM